MGISICFSIRDASYIQKNMDIIIKSTRLWFLSPHHAKRRESCIENTTEFSALSAGHLIGLGGIDRCKISYGANITKDIIFLHDTSHSFKHNCDIKDSMLIHDFIVSLCAGIYRSRYDVFIEATPLKTLHYEPCFLQICAAEFNFNTVHRTLYPNVYAVDFRVSSPFFCEFITILRQRDYKALKKKFESIKTAASTKHTTLKAYMIHFLISECWKINSGVLEKIGHLSTRLKEIYSLELESSVNVFVEFMRLILTSNPMHVLKSVNCSLCEEIFLQITSFFMDVHVLARMIASKKKRFLIYAGNGHIEKLKTKISEMFTIDEKNGAADENEMCSVGSIVPKSELDVFSDYIWTNRQKAIFNIMENSCRVGQNCVMKRVEFKHECVDDTTIAAYIKQIKFCMDVMLSCDRNDSEVDKKHYKEYMRHLIACLWLPVIKLKFPNKQQYTICMGDVCTKLDIQKQTGNSPEIKVRNGMIHMHELILQQFNHYTIGKLLRYILKPTKHKKLPTRQVMRLNRILKDNMHKRIIQ